MTLPQEELCSLLVACRKGRDDAARALWSALAGTLISYARSVLRDPALAEDAVQNALVRFMSRPLREVRAVRDPHAWLVTIVRREALTMLRRATRHERRRLEAVGGASLDDPGTPSAVGEPVAEAISRLPRHEREVVTLRHVAGMTYEQIGLAIGVNHNTVASRHRSAVRRLREALSGEAQVPLPARDTERTTPKEAVR